MNEALHLVPAGLHWDIYKRPRGGDSADGDPMFLALGLESREELAALHREASHQIGSQRAPAEDLPILVFGYTQGRMDQLQRQDRDLAAERRATVERIRAAITAWDADTLRAMLDRFSWEQFVDTCMNDLDAEADR